MSERYNERNWSNGDMQNYPAFSLEVRLYLFLKRYSLLGCLFFSWFCLAVSCSFMLKSVTWVWLFGGEKLVINNEKLIYSSAFLVGAICFRFVVPSLLSFIFRAWRSKTDLI
jgi:hypothetical protein